MFSNRRATSGGVLVPHVVPMVSGSKRGSHTVPSGLPWSSYNDKALSVTPLRRSGEGIESFYCDIGGVLPVTTACPLDGVGGGATSDTVAVFVQAAVVFPSSSSLNGHPGRPGKRAAGGGGRPGARGPGRGPTVVWAQPGCLGFFMTSLQSATF